MNAAPASLVATPPTGLRQIRASELEAGKFYYMQRTAVEEPAYVWRGWALVKLFPDDDPTKFAFKFHSKLTGGVWAPNAWFNTEDDTPIQDNKSDILSPAGGGGVGASNAQAESGPGIYYRFWVPVPPEMSGGRRRRRTLSRRRRQGRKSRQSHRRHRA